MPGLALLFSRTQPAPRQTVEKLTAEILSRRAEKVCHDAFRVKLVFEFPLAKVSFFD
jgi:hypothetical protein